MTVSNPKPPRAAPAERKVLRAQPGTQETKPRAYARRRRSPARAHTQAAPSALALRISQLNPVKVGIGMFFVWFAVANWTNLQHVAMSALSP